VLVFFPVQHWHVSKRPLKMASLGGRLREVIVYESLYHWAKRFLH